MNWGFTDLVLPERQNSLNSCSSFEDIIGFIASEMVTKRMLIRLGCQPEVRGCKRPEFQLEVQPRTFDLFFNSSCGLRAQYLRSPEVGDAANTKLISRILQKLLDHAAESGGEHSMEV